MKTPSLNALGNSYLSKLEAFNIVSPDFEILGVPCIEGDLTSSNLVNSHCIGVMQFRKDGQDVVWIAERRAEGYHLTATHRLLPLSALDAIISRFGTGENRSFFAHHGDNVLPDAPLVRRVYLDDFDAFRAFVEALTTYFGDFLKEPTISLASLCEQDINFVKGHPNHSRFSEPLLFINAAAYIFSENC